MTTTLSRNDTRRRTVAATAILPDSIIGGSSPSERHVRAVEKTGAPHLQVLLSASTRRRVNVKAGNLVTH